MPNQVVARLPIVKSISPNYGAGVPAFQKIFWSELTLALFKDDEPIWIEHPTLEASADFVAIPIEEACIDAGILYDLAALPPDREIVLGPTDQVSVIGFPFGLTAAENFAIWVNGTIASEPEMSYDGKPLMLIDCRSRPGQSGSPVIAFRPPGMVSLKNGNLAAIVQPLVNFLGIYSGRIHKDSDIGMVWKAGAIRELLAIF